MPKRPDSARVRAAVAAGDPPASAAYPDDDGWYAEQERWLAKWSPRVLPKGPLRRQQWKNRVKEHARLVAAALAEFHSCLAEEHSLLSRSPELLMADSLHAKRLATSSVPLQTFGVGVCPPAPRGMLTVVQGEEPRGPSQGTGSWSFMSWEPRLPPARPAFRLVRGCHLVPQWYADDLSWSKATAKAHGRGASVAEAGDTGDTATPIEFTITESFSLTFVADQPTLLRSCYRFTIALLVKPEGP